MRTDTRIVISLDKQFYSDDEEMRIHVWFNHDFSSSASLTVQSPHGVTVDSKKLRADPQITETFAFTCGGPFMFENGYYTIRVECQDAVSETMFEYFNSKNRFKPKFEK